MRLSERNQKLLKYALAGLVALMVLTSIFENLIALNKDPDLVLDRGHDFGGKDVYAPDGSIALPALGESERRDLIEYLKTF